MTFTIVTIYRKPEPSCHEFLQRFIALWLLACDKKPPSQSRETTPPCGYGNKKKIWISEKPQDINIGDQVGIAGD